jgi:hypothetical protein
MIVSDSTTGPGSWRGAEPGPGWHWVGVPCPGIRFAAVSMDPEVYVEDTIEGWHFPRVDRAATAKFTSMPVGVVLSFMAFSEPVSRHPVGPPTTPVMPVTSTTLLVGTTEPAGGSHG